MKIAIIGSNGQLGSDLLEVLYDNDEVIGLTHSDIDIGDYVQSREALLQIKPDVIINTAAMHNVPKCEENPLLAYQINGLGSLHLAKISNELKCVLVHYSTDYVFDGLKMAPYFEGDVTNPLNVYSVTKLAGENYIKNYCDRGYVIRVSGIYGKVPSRAKGGSNFITTMIRLAKEKSEVKVVSDEILTPTSTYDIALNTKLLVEQQPDFGVYHMTNEGECSWYEFATEIFSTLQLTTPLYETTVKEMSVPIKRPFYSVLENNMLKNNNINIMPHWKKSLETFLLKNYLA